MLIKRIVLLSVCLVIGSLSVAVLTLGVSWRNNRSNSFVRKVPSHLYLGERPTKLQVAGYYIVGVSKTHCYLASHRDWSQLMQLDSNGRITPVPLKFSEKNANVYTGAIWAVDERHILLFDGMAGEIWQGDIEKGFLRRKKVGFAFAKGVSLDNDTYILRTINENQFVFKKADSNGRVTVYPKFLDRIGKGLFAPDGILTKAGGSNRLFYVPYYKNKFLSVDSGLNLIYQGKTIDTVANPQIKTAYLKSSQSFTMASPPPVVNRRAFANNKYLFVQSSMRADNETSEMHDENSAIDIYRVADGKYLFSIYLPKVIGGERLTDLTVLNNCLIALYGQYVFRFRLNF